MEEVFSARSKVNLIRQAIDWVASNHDIPLLLGRTEDIAHIMSSRLDSKRSARAFLLPGLVVVFFFLSGLGGVLGDESLKKPLEDIIQREHCCGGETNWKGKR